MKEKSRATRYSEAQDKVCDALSEPEELRDELQSWRDGMPENLQASSKADELDEAISVLEEAIGHAEEIIGTLDVEFTSVFG